MRDDGTFQMGSMAEGHPMGYLMGGGIAAGVVAIIAIGFMMFKGEDDDDDEDTRV